MSEEKEPFSCVFWIFQPLAGGTSGKGRKWPLSADFQEGRLSAPGNWGRPRKGSDFFSRDFMGSVGIKNPCFFGGFPWLFSKKQGKEGQGFDQILPDSMEPG